MPTNIMVRQSSTPDSEFSKNLYILNLAGKKMPGLQN